MTKPIKKKIGEAVKAAKCGNEVAKDSIEIVKRLIARNPVFKASILDESMPLEDFAMIVIIQWKAFNRVT
jgi:hypothetical protein